MSIMFFDCGTRTGWAVRDNRGEIRSGVKPFKFDGVGFGDRMVMYRFWVLHMIDTYRPSIVGFEMAHHRGGVSTDLLLNMSGRVREVCAIKSTPCLSAHSGQIKKFITGHGKASKEAVIEAVSKRLNREIIDDNEADALAGLLLLISKNPA